MSIEIRTPAITGDQPLNTIVANYPQTLPILQRFGLDTCCGGAIPLSIATEHHGLDLAQVLTALQAATAEEQK
jgi:iron-sulfur cluster repair protein YtfE (RIC family)